MLKKIIAYWYLGSFCQCNSADQGLDSLILQIVTVPGQVTLTSQQDVHS